MPQIRFDARAACAVATLLLAAPNAGAEWVDWIADAEVAVEYTDNLNTSAFDSDEEYDFSWYPKVRGGRVFQLGDRTRISLAAELGGEIYHRFDRLNAFDGGGRVSAFHKFGIGNAPWMQASFFGGYKNVAESERSGPRFEVGVTAGKRFSPRFDASVGWRYTNRDGGAGPVAVPTLPRDVFDQTYHTISVAGNLLLLEPLLITGGYTFRTGDFDSACTPANVGTVLAEADVKAISLDKVFGGCVYRLVGVGHAVFANVSYGFTDRISLDLGYRFQAGSSGGLQYRTNTARLALLYRY